MGFMRNRMLRRFTVVGRVLDAFLLAGIGLRYAHRKGWVTDDLMRSVGLASVVDQANANAASPAPADAVLGVGAVWRIWRRRRLR